MPESEASGESRRRSRAAWTVLGILLASLLLGALSFDPGRWPSVVGDEATYLMAAQSLAWDRDLRYSAADLERFRALLEREPEGLILQRSTDDGELRYAKPVFYPLAIAPFVRVLPRRGAVVANVAILALASVLSALALGRRVGVAAPVWVACFVFASVAFAHAFWAHADLLLLSLVASALALVVLSTGGTRGSPRDAASAEPARRRGAQGALAAVWSWLARREAGLVVAGGLLGVVTISRPVYLAVALPALVLAGKRNRALRVSAGLGVVLLLSLVGNLVVRGTWSSYSGERHGYYSYTGFPLEGGGEGTGGTAQAVEGAVGPSASWTERIVPFGFDLRVTAWNLIYLVLGRDVGVLPYLLPLVLGFVALDWKSRGSRWRSAALLAAFGAVATAFLILRPFNFWGGGGALANRYLLPVYPCFWFLAERRRGVTPVIAVTLLAAPFLWPTWTAPRGFFRGDDGGYRHVSAVARRVLPYETTQNQLKPSGRDDFVHAAVDETEGGGFGALWVKPLSPWVRAVGDDSIAVTVGESGVGLLVGSPRPLPGLRVRVETGGASGVEVPVELGWRRVHAMWWTKGEPYFLVPIDLEGTLRGLPVTPVEGEVVGLRLVAVDR